MKRRTGLKSDPEKVREWMNKSRKPLSPGTRKQRKVISGGTRNRVRKRSGGRCVMCKHLLLTGEADPREYPNGARRIDHLHHVLPVQHFPDYELEEENMVGMCDLCHTRHERAFRRIPWEALPSVVRLFVYEMATDGMVDAFVRRTYPGYMPQGEA